MPGVVPLGNTALTLPLLEILTVTFFTVLPFASKTLEVAMVEVKVLGNVVVKVVGLLNGLPAEVLGEGIDAKQLEFIDFLVTQYIESGVGELEESKLETLLEIKYSDVFNAVQTLGKGDVGKVRKLFLDFQKNLYIPHKEYQRVS